VRKARGRRILTLKRVLVTVAAVAVWVVVYELSHFAAVLVLLGVVTAVPILLVRDTTGVWLFGAGSRLRDDPKDWSKEDDGWTDRPRRAR